MAKIERHQKDEKLSRIVVHKGTIYLSGLTADDRKADTAGQTRQILQKADALLKSVGADRSRLLCAQIWLKDVADFDAMNKAWVVWLDGAEPPARYGRSKLRVARYPCRNTAYRRRLLISGVR